MSSSYMEAANGKIVFLEIDGVLNGNGIVGDSKKCFAMFDDAAMVHLRRLLEQSGARIVLSTPWRKHLAYLNEVFGNYGLLGPVCSRSGPENPIHSEMRTPVFADPRRRDKEILRWLQVNRAQLGVQCWVALDCMDLLAHADTRAGFEGRTVRTDPYSGLTDEDVNRALAILERVEESQDSSVHAVAQPVNHMANIRNAMQPMDEHLLRGMGAVLDALEREGGCPMEQGLTFGARCSEGHLLQSFTVSCTGFCCEECGIDMEEGAAVMQCTSCGDVIFCDGCVAIGLHQPCVEAD